MLKEEVYEFGFVAEIPVFKKCRRIDKEEGLDCFNSEKTNPLMDNFRCHEEAGSNNIKGKIEVSFNIGANGKIIDALTSGRVRLKGILCCLVGLFMLKKKGKML